MLKVVIFVDGKKDDSSCTDEKWRRFQCLIPDEAYKELKEAILKIDKKYGGGCLGEEYAVS